MQVALCPQTYLDTFRACVVAKAFQVGDVAVQSAGLSVAGAVSVVRQEPSERHIVVEVAIDGGPGGELVVIVFPVEAFACAAVILLALVVALAVLVEHEAVFGRRPVVAVVGVEVSFVETEFRQQHGVSRQLVEVAEQVGRRFVYHEEYVEVVLVVAEYDTSVFRCAEVVASRTECMPQQAVAGGRPIERSGRCHASVDPVVGIFDGDYLSAVREASVLHAAAVEVFISVHGQCHRHLAIFVGQGLYPFGHDLSGFAVFHFHQSRLAVQCHADASGLYVDACFGGIEFQSAHGAPCIVHQDMGFGAGFRLTQDASLVVLKQAEDVAAVEVECKAFAVGEEHFHCRRVDFPGLGDLHRVRLDHQRLLRQRHGSPCRFGRSEQQRRQQGGASRAEECCFFFHAYRVLDVAC